MRRTNFGLGNPFFGIIVPICCGLMIASILSTPYSSTRYTRLQMAKRLFVFGLTLFLMTPVSVFISRQIDETYRTSVEEAIQTTDEATGAIREMKSDESAEGAEGDTSPLGALQQQFDNVSSAVGGAVETVGGFAAGILPWAINQLRSYAELFAVMVVTSIVIPLLVPVVVYFMFKILFLSDSDVTVPAPLVEALASGGSRLSGAGPRPGIPAGANEGSGHDAVQAIMASAAAAEPGDVTVEQDTATAED